MRKLLSKIDSRHKAGVWVDQDQMKSPTYSSCLYWHDILLNKLQEMAKKDMVYDFDSREISEVIKARERFELFQNMLTDGIKDYDQQTSYVRNQRASFLDEAKSSNKQLTEHLNFILDNMISEAEDKEVRCFRRQHLSETVRKLVDLSMLIQKIENLEFVEES